MNETQIKLIINTITRKLSLKEDCEKYKIILELKYWLHHFGIISGGALIEPICKEEDFK